MAFYKHYIIPFKSLRQGTDYTVNVYKDGAPSGGVKTIDGAADTFTTEEDDDDDMFTPMRTQSGTLRIIATDDLDWRTMMPQNTFDTPVTLTAGSTVVWQGFMNPDSFGNQLYMQGRDIEECELGKRIYFADGEVELSDKEVAIVKQAVAGYSYVARTAIEQALG